MSVAVQTDGVHHLCSPTGSPLHEGLPVLGGIPRPGPGASLLALPLLSASATFMRCQCIRRADRSLRMT